jgi:hypothetical protein
MNRRRFLGHLVRVPLASGLGLALPLRPLIVAVGCATPPRENAQRLTPALKVLRDVLQTEAQEAADPWSICHAMLGVGPTLQLTNGKPAIDHLIETFLRRDANGRPYFEVEGSNGQVGEQHPFLVLKKLVEMNLQPELWRPLAEGGLEKQRRPLNAADWDGITWLLWAAVQLPGYSAGTVVGPDKVTLGDLAQGVVERVELGDRPVEASLSTNGEAGFKRPSANDPSARDSIWRYTCGGQHLLQTLIACQERGYLPAEARTRVEARIVTFVRRLNGEANSRSGERRRGLEEKVDPRMVEHYYALDILKLLGHGLETLGRARDAGLGSEPALARAAREAIQRLDASQVGLQRTMALGPFLASMRQKSPVTWRQWIGDGCHTLHGLGYW